MAMSGWQMSFTKGEGGCGQGKQKQGEDKGGCSKGGAGRGCCLSLLPKWRHVIYVLFSFVFIGALEINYERQKKIKRKWSLNLEQRNSIKQTSLWE